MAPLRQRGYMRELERLERESYRVAAAVCAGALGALLTCVLFAS